jgi:hypothetical protein
MAGLAGRIDGHVPSTPAGPPRYSACTCAKIRAPIAANFWPLWWPPLEGCDEVTNDQLGRADRMRGAKNHSHLEVGKSHVGHGYHPPARGGTRRWRRSVPSSSSKSKAQRTRGESRWRYVRRRWPASCARRVTACGSTSTSSTPKATSCSATRARWGWRVLSRSAWDRGTGRGGRQTGLSSRTRTRLQ